MALLLTAIGFVLITLTWVIYLAAIPRETVPARPIAHIVAMLVGLAAVTAGLMESFDPIDGLSIALAISALGLAGFFFFLLTIARLPDGELQVGVGDALLGFTAHDSSGMPVSTDAWQGQRILLKFFRGKW
jgi:hypothetical protein